MKTNIFPFQGTIKPSDRHCLNGHRSAEVSKLMVDSGILVFAAFIAPYRNSRNFVRELMAEYPFYECFVRCPVDECEKRDPKGLYERTRKGEITNMTGISAPYEEPENPDLIIETNLFPLNNCVDQLINFLIFTKIIFSRSPDGNLLFGDF